MSNEQFLSFSKPFIDACKSVFSLMVDVEIEIGKPLVKDQSKSSGDITSIMGISGVYESESCTNKFQGMLCLSFPTGTYLKVASGMLGQEYTEFDDDIRDVGNEITNIIMGNAKGVLSETGYKIEMSIPSLIIGKGHLINYPKKSTIILIPITCDHGDFFIELCYQDVAS